MIGVQHPRIHSVPLHDPKVGEDAVRWVREHKLSLDEGQELILAGGLGTRPDGKFAAFEVCMLMPRQNGKGEVLLARELYGAIVLGERLIIHSAHEFATSQEHFRRMEDKIEEAGLQSELKPKVGVRKSHGEEGFEFRNGSRIRFRTRTKGGGRGFTGDLVVLDEAMILAAEFHGVLLPIVSARSQEGNPQVWYAGSAVDQFIHEHGIVLAGLRERGLARESDLAYYEWSIDAENPEEVPDQVLSDPANWAAANLALGSRISVEHVGREYKAMGKRQFAVERGCIGDWPRSDGMSTVFDLDLWDDLKDPKSAIVGSPVFSFDVTPDRRKAVIAAIGRNAEGFLHVEVTKDGDGTGWLVAELARLELEHLPLGIVCDSVGPASSLLPQLEMANVSVIAVQTPEMGKACGAFYDAVQQKQIRHLGTPDLLGAIKGAVQRPLGDSWAWSRRNSTSDISPLVACTLGVWKVVTEEQRAPMFAFG